MQIKGTTSFRSSSFFLPTHAGRDSVRGAEKPVYCRLAAYCTQQIVSRPREAGAETPSVPGRPGTSSLPTWPPRQLCHWRRTAAAGTAALPPPAAPPETPPAACEGPGALVGSPRTEKNKRGETKNGASNVLYTRRVEQVLCLIAPSPVFIDTRVLVFRLNHFRTNLLFKWFINQFDLNFSILSTYLSSCLVVWNPCPSSSILVWPAALKGDKREEALFFLPEMEVKTLANLRQNMIKKKTSKNNTLTHFHSGTQVKWSEAAVWWSLCSSISENMCI